MSTEQDIKTKSDELPAVSQPAQEAEKIIEQMPEATRQAMEAMQRTLRARRNKNETEPRLRYRKFA
jgi:hypothetical protein